MTEYPHKAKSRVREDQNLSLPFDPTGLFRDWANALPDNPRNAYLKSALFSKFVSKDTDPAEVRQDRAMKKWLSIEAVNAETNERLLSTPDDCVLFKGSKSSVRFSAFIDKASQIVESVIGAMPSEPFGAFSGGASTSRTRDVSHPARKYVGRSHLTSGCHDVIESLSPDWVLWHSVGFPELEIVRGAVMFTVPKDTYIDRIACKEPDINMYLQKAYGSQIRRCLRKVGINLNDQSRNRGLALAGSKSGLLATLDLSSASDSVSSSLVELLLPPLWFSALNSVRSEEMRILTGEWYRCEMFSTMGNGFTFELESLIFYALARTVAWFTGTSGVISVYGDDIILPVGMYDVFVHVLFYFGFTPNNAKSFRDGPFRESCGGHYWNGDDITPFFIRRPIVRLSDLMHCLNALRIWAGRGSHVFLNEDAWELWDLLSELVPAKFYGGDLVSSSVYQLISPGRPRKRLSPANIEDDVPESGRYLMWQDSHTNAIGGQLVDGHEATRSLPICRVKTARWTGWHSCGPLFLQEFWAHDVPG